LFNVGEARNLNDELIRPFVLNRAFRHPTQGSDAVLQNPLHVRPDSCQFRTLLWLQIRYLKREAHPAPNVQSEIVLGPRVKESRKAGEHQDGEQKQIAL
jgi:hypothetical protein